MKFDISVTDEAGVPVTGLKAGNLRVQIASNGFSDHKATVDSVVEYGQSTTPGLPGFYGVSVKPKFIWILDTPPSTCCYLKGHTRTRGGSLKN